MNSVIELNYHKTNTFLIRGEDRYLLFDTGAPGTLESFLKALETAGFSPFVLSMSIIISVF